MTRTLIIILLAIAALFATTNTQAQETASDDKTATYSGTMKTGAANLRLELDVKTDGDQPTAILRSVDQGNAQMKTDSLEITDELLKFTVPKIHAHYQGTFDSNHQVIDGTFTQNGRQYPLKFVLRNGNEEANPSSEKLKEAWIGTLNLGAMEMVMQFRIVDAEDEPNKVYFDSVTEGPGGFVGTWSIKEDQLSFEIPAIKLTYEGTLNEKRDSAEGTWNQANREIPLTLTKHDTEYRSQHIWENRPQRPQPPYPYLSEDVSFAGAEEDVTLAGTLTIPKAAGPHSAVILISGSGPSDRDESIMQHKPFAVLADHLSRHGIAVLRYDDRGTAASTGNFSTATTQDFANDASAAIDFLVQDKRIDSSKIGLAGHSEGGLIAPLTENSRSDVAFVVLLAGTGVNGFEISISQNAAMLQAADMDAQEIALSSNLTRQVLQAAIDTESAEDLEAKISEIIESMAPQIPEEQRQLFEKNSNAAFMAQIPRLRSPWMQFFLKHEPAPALEKIECPVLFMIGSKDLQVVPEVNVPPMKKALAEHKDATVLELEQLNHLFQKCETGTMTEYKTIDETFNPQALEIISNWINQRFGKQTDSE